MSNPADRTRRIEIQDDNLNLKNIQNAPVTFDLGLNNPKPVPHEKSLEPKLPNHSHQADPNRLVFGVTPPPLEHNSVFNPAAKNPVQPVNHSKNAFNLAHHLKKHSQHAHQTLKNLLKKKPAPVDVPRGPTSLRYKIWNGLEFISLTGAIFMVLFLIMNYASYSQLFVSKLNILRGQVNQNPVITGLQENLRKASPEMQKPLPIAPNQSAAQKQIPALDMEIAPPDDRVIIPRISQNVPIVRVPADKLIQRDWAALEGQIQEALREGVVHYPGTAMPGEQGNVVLTGHSSYFPWDAGRFKDVFALLHQVNIGDKVIVYYEQKKFTYEVIQKVTVKPSQVDILTQNGEDKLTLITCTPVGTALNRLVVIAKPV